MANIYIVCSVRNAPKEEMEKVLAYVEGLERDGHAVLCPFRDTAQEDETGLRIVEEHEDDIIWADEIHIWWNPTSEGSRWDIAQARMARRFMPAKKIVVANTGDMEIMPHKSYTNVILMTHFGLGTVSSLADLKEARAKECRGAREKDKTRTSSV